jgi:formylmethanofuran dehydrogenase subunit E
VQAKSRWHHYLYAYQAMPDEQLFEGQAIRLHTPIAAIVSKPGARVTCRACREEIMNEREIWIGDQPYCKTCSGQSYYEPLQHQG